MTCVFMDDLTPDKGRKLNVHKAFRRHPGRLFDMNDCSNWFRMIKMPFGNSLQPKSLKF